MALALLLGSSSFDFTFLSIFMCRRCVTTFDGFFLFSHYQHNNFCPVDLKFLISKMLKMFRVFIAALFLFIFVIFFIVCGTTCGAYYWIRYYRTLPFLFSFFLFFISLSIFQDQLTVDVFVFRRTMNHEQWFQFEIHTEYELIMNKIKCLKTSFVRSSFVMCFHPFFVLLFCTYFVGHMTRFMENECRNLLVQLLEIHSIVRPFVHRLWKMNDDEHTSNLISLLFSNTFFLYIYLLLLLLYFLCHFIFYFNDLFLLLF